MEEMLAHSEFGMSRLTHSSHEGENIPYQRQVRVKSFKEWDWSSASLEKPDMQSGPVSTSEITWQAASTGETWLSATETARLQGRVYHITSCEHVRCCDKNA